MMTDILKRYQQVAGEEIINELSSKAHLLKGIKVLHINSTKEGGGVAEILMSLTQLLTALGIENNWEIIEGNPNFFECTKLFHNAIQGQKDSIPSLHLLNAYEEINQINAEKLKPLVEEADIVFVHDPQPAALINYFPERKNKWVWRCHIDASNPEKDVWNFIRNFVYRYDASIFSLKEFAQLLPHPIFIIPPGIDPLSQKNINLSQDEINAIYSTFLIDPTRPFILQVSRFDYFKDPIGVIQAYRFAKKHVPDLQLVLAGGGASDDPEGAAVLNAVKNAAAHDEDIHILYLPSDAHTIINALQRASAIILQKSLKEGFGLTVSEGLWKDKPVIGGNVGGIRLQVINDKNGFLVNTPEEAGEKIQYLIQNRSLMDQMGKNGRRHVLEHFLITRYLRDELDVMLSLLYPNQKNN